MNRTADCRPLRGDALPLPPVGGRRRIDAARRAARERRSDWRDGSASSDIDATHHRLGSRNSCTVIRRRRCHVKAARRGKTERRARPTRGSARGQAQSARASDRRASGPFLRHSLLRVAGMKKLGATSRRDTKPRGACVRSSTARLRCRDWRDVVAAGSTHLKGPTSRFTPVGEAHGRSHQRQRSKLRIRRAERNARVERRRFVFRIRSDVRRSNGRMFGAARRSEQKGSVVSSAPAFRHRAMGCRRASSLIRRIVFVKTKARAAVLAKAGSVRASFMRELLS